MTELEAIKESIRRIKVETDRDKDRTFRGRKEYNPKKTISKYNYYREQANAIYTYRDGSYGVSITLPGDIDFTSSGRIKS